jgi:uncharacterized protein (UPF0335 family)
MKHILLTITLILGATAVSADSVEEKLDLIIEKLERLEQTYEQLFEAGEAIK